MTSEELITIALADGKTHAEIQAQLQQAWDETDIIPTEVAIGLLAMNQETLLTISIKLFVQAVELTGAEVDGAAMAQAYIESFRLSQDAYLYDHFHQFDDHPEHEGQMSIDDALEEE